ncbi:hypothetical protein [Methanimicrococcus stummii]|uniref:hypothetical protein n=1 Tax=Methanimicrococcus stummii TaxID=3028294 RepID=UPI00292D97C1|nr:hypothetical protein [Methanimicrococcus sp. Es2]
MLFSADTVCIYIFFEQPFASRTGRRCGGLPHCCAYACPLLPPAPRASRTAFQKMNEKRTRFFKKAD